MKDKDFDKKYNAALKNFEATLAKIMENAENEKHHAFELFKEAITDEVKDWSYSDLMSLIESSSELDAKKVGMVANCFAASHANSNLVDALGASILSSCMIAIIKTEL